MISSVSIRTMRLEDISQVALIENHWHGEAGATEMEVHWALGRTDVVSISACLGKPLVGYLFAEVRKLRRNIVQIGVDPGFVRMGIGRLLIKTLKERVKTRLPWRADVRESDLRAQLFFRACGFRCDRVISDYFQGESAYGFTEIKEDAKCKR